MLCCCRCCCTAATTVFQVQTLQKFRRGVPENSSVYVCKNSLMREATKKVPGWETLADTGCNVSCVCVGVHMPGGCLVTHCSCREALQAHRHHHQGAAEQQGSGPAARTTSGGSMSACAAPGSLQADRWQRRQ